MNKRDRDALTAATKQHIEWSEKYIADFIKNHGFIPFDALTGEEDKQQQLYGACVEYLYNLEEAILKVNEQFERSRNKVVFG
jgi:transposase